MVERCEYNMLALSFLTDIQSVPFSLMLESQGQTDLKCVCLFCLSISAISFLSFTFSLSLRSFHPPPILFFSYMLSLFLFPCSVSFSHSLFITSGIQLAGIVDAITKNDVINYLGSDYVIKLLCVCTLVYVRVNAW